jgi:hypothetical protein
MGSLFPKENILKEMATNVEYVKPAFLFWPIRELSGTPRKLLQVNSLIGKESMSAFHPFTGSYWADSISSEVIVSFLQFRICHHVQLRFCLSIFFLDCLWPITSSYQSLTKRPMPPLLGCVPKILSSPGPLVYPNSCRTPIAFYQNASRQRSLLRLFACCITMAPPPIYRYCIAIQCERLHINLTIYCDEVPALLAPFVKTLNAL